MLNKIIKVVKNGEPCSLYHGDMNIEYHIGVTNGGNSFKIFSNQYSDSWRCGHLSVEDLLTNIKPNLEELHRRDETFNVNDAIDFIKEQQVVILSSCFSVIAFPNKSNLGVITLEKDVFMQIASGNKHLYYTEDELVTYVKE